MKKILTISLIMSLAMVMIASLTTPAESQLILNNQRLKIVKVEREFNRLQARVHEGDNPSVQYILIDGNTKFSTQGRELSFNEAWNHFKPDMIIRVKGGLTLTGQTKAITIYW